MRNRMVALVGTAFLTGAVIASLSLNVYGAQITEEEAREIALDDAGLAQEDAVSVQVRTDEEDGRGIFEVEFFDQENAEYDYEILMEDGFIYSSSYEVRGSGLGGQETTLEQAKEIAAEHAGVSLEEASFSKEETDRENGGVVYELEFSTDDDKQFEYEVAGASGAILCWDYDGKRHHTWMEEHGSEDHHSEGAHHGAQAGAVTGPEQAKQEALKKAGLTDDQVTWGRVHEDYEDGRVVYEGKFYYDSKEYEFEIDAATGEMISWESESIWD